MTQENKTKINWNCCKDAAVPNWSEFDALELAGCIEVDGGIERAENEEETQFYTLYGHCVEGGCEALHDFLTGYKDLKAIKKVCKKLAKRLGFELWDYT